MRSAAVVLLTACAIFCAVYAHRHRGMPPPAFLSSFNETVRKGFFDIIKKPNLTLEEKKAQVMNWAKTYGLEEQAKKQIEKIEGMMKKHPGHNGTEIRIYDPGSVC
ncbi:hypothetical protein COOONC_03128 [Cooperia oncophora]